MKLFETNSVKTGYTNKTACRLHLSCALIHRFPNYLNNKGYMPTTIRNMMLNVVSLYNHVKNVFLEESRLKVEDIDRVLYELTRLQAEIRRDVVIQQQRVKRQKTS